VSGDLVQSVDQEICEWWHFTISEISGEFPQISRTLLYEIITVRLCYPKFCARWVTKMLMGAKKMQRMALVIVDIFTAIPQKWWYISQSHSNRRWNLGFICEC
jgi:hypothetical protein